MARTAVHRIGIVVFDGVKLLDVAGPSEVFSEANRMGAHYELTLCAVGGDPVSSSTGMTIAANADATDPQLRFDTLLVTGGDVFPAHPVDPELCEAVTSAAARSGRVCSICTGAFILAAAGLLDGRRATTHWRHTGVLSRGYPNITPKLAALAAMSPRHLTRLFHEELGTTPAKYVESMRFDGAKAALESGYTITEAAERVGYGGTVALVDDGFGQGGLMRCRSVRVPVPRFGFVGFRFPVRSSCWWCVGT